MPYALDVEAKIRTQLGLSRAQVYEFRKQLFGNRTIRIGSSGKHHCPCTAVGLRGFERHLSCLSKTNSWQTL